MGPEKKFENQIRAFLSFIGAYHVKYFGCAYTRSGVPDLLCCVGGRFVAIEVKAENGRVSTAQELEIKKIHDSNGIAVVVRPSEFDKLKGLLLALQVVGAEDKQPEEYLN